MALTLILFLKISYVLAKISRCFSIAAKGETLMSLSSTASLEKCFKSTFEVIHNILHVFQRLCLPVDDLGLARLHSRLQRLGSLLGLLGELLDVGEQLLGDFLRALPRGP